MNFLETCNLAITTLSPIHIGCGEDYEPTNYVIDSNRLYTFDPVLLLRELPMKAQEEFARIVEGRDSLRVIQSFFYRYKQGALKVGRLNANVAETVQDFYDSRIGQVAQREPGGNVLSKLEIARTAFNPISGLPILPGSSIKGAIRTAVLESLRQRQGFRKSRDMESEILGGSFSTDPFRFLKISDGAFRSKIQRKAQDGSIQHVERRPRVCLQVNRKKRPNQYEARGIVNTLLECIPANTPQAFVARWVIEQKAGRGGQMPGLQLDFETVALACNRFYGERLQAEIDLHNYTVKWSAGMGKAMGPGGFLKKMADEGQGFLLRVGRHSGAESVTVNAPRSIKIMKGKGQSPEYAEEATTLWLAADRKDQMENMQPFGWVFVTRTP
jgi:CRISPR-associated protein Csm5